jgi:hypothetical protein
MQAHRLVRAARRHNSRRSCGQSRHKGRRRHRRHLNRNRSCEDHRHRRAVRRHSSRRSCGQFRRNRRRPRHHNRRHKSVACSHRHSQGRCNRCRRCSLHRSRGRCSLRRSRGRCNLRRRSRFSRHRSNGPLRLRSSKGARRRNPAKSLPNPSRGNGNTKKRAAAPAARQIWRTRVAQCSSTFLNCQASRLSMSSGKSPGRPVRGVQSV